MLRPSTSSARQGPGATRGTPPKGALAVVAFEKFNPQTQAQRQVLFDNTARAMGDAPDFIKRRHVDNCSKADPAYGAGVEAALRKLGAFA